MKGVFGLGFGLALGLALCACGSDLGRLPVGTMPTPVPKQLEEIRQSAFAADTVLELARKAITIPFPGGSVTVDYQNGWYSIRVVMFGSDRSLRFQFQDAHGAAMYHFSPTQTRSIRIQTLVEDSLGLRHFDLTLRGVELGSDEFRVSGSGRLVQGDQEWDFYAQNITLAKVGNPYPLRGEAVLETEHADQTRSSLHFRFNGSRIVDGRFESGSVTALFTLDLVSLEVNLVEPTP